MDERKAQNFKYEIQSVNFQKFNRDTQANEKNETHQMTMGAKE